MFHLQCRFFDDLRRAALAFNVASPPFDRRWPEGISTALVAVTWQNSTDDREKGPAVNFAVERFDPSANNPIEDHAVREADQYLDCDVGYRNPEPGKDLANANSKILAKSHHGSIQVRIVG